MQIEKSITVNQPVSQVWKVVADDFANAAEWMTGIGHSHSIPAVADKSAHDGRVCIIENKAGGLKAEENILMKDDKNTKIVFEVFPRKEKGPGLPIKKNVITIKLHAVSDNKTKVIWCSEPDLKFMGKLLSPILRIGLGSFFAGVLRDLKVFVETGSISEQKKKFNQKFGEYDLAG